MNALHFSAARVSGGNMARGGVRPAYARHSTGHHPGRALSVPLALVALALVAGALALFLAPAAVARAGALAMDADGGGPTDQGVTACEPRTLVVYARSLSVETDQWICGDADAYGGSVRVLGHVGGNVTAFGGSVTIAGVVDGNVTALGGNVNLLPTARVAGDVQVWGGSLHRAPTAIVYGDINSGNRMSAIVGDVWPGLSTEWRFPVLWVLAWALLAAVVVTLFPERTTHVRLVARAATGRSLVVGLLTAVLGTGLAGVLFVTCIGIPLSLLVLGGLLVGWVLGTVAVGLWLGERLVGAVASGRRSPLLAAVVGVTVLSGIESIPCLGSAVALIAGSLGLGAALLSRFGGPRAASSLPAPVPPFC